VIGLLAPTLLAGFVRVRGVAAWGWGLGEELGGDAEVGQQTAHGVFGQSSAARAVFDCPSRFRIFRFLPRRWVMPGSCLAIDAMSLASAMRSLVCRVQSSSLHVGGRR